MARPDTELPADMPVEVVRSARRKKTVQARVVDGRLQVLVPACLSSDEVEARVAQMRERLRRKLSSHHIDLPARAARLAKAHGLAGPEQITWSDRQEWRWGSCTPSRGTIRIHLAPVSPTQSGTPRRSSRVCTPSRGTIRISRRLASMPDWVLDYVIVHELAHLEVPGHGADFEALVRRYPRAERARGYLIAKAEQT